MPSHPDRIRQNYCEHEVLKLVGDMGIAQFCIKCGKYIYIDRLVTKKDNAQ